MNTSTPNSAPSESNENNANNKNGQNVEQDLHTFQPEEGPLLPQQRREQLLAFHLDALDDEMEAELIRGRLDVDQDWQLASDEAEKMLAGLQANGLDAVEVPGNLGERTVRRLMQDSEFVDVPKNAPVDPESALIPSKAEHDGVEKSTAAVTGKMSSRSTKSKPNALKPIGLEKSPFVFTRKVAAAILCVVLGSGLWFVNSSYFNRPTMEYVEWQTNGRLTAGGPFVPDLVVRHAESSVPVKGVVLTGFLSKVNADANSKGALDIVLGEAHTDALGMFTGDAWAVPENLSGAYRLAIEARNPNGKLLERVEQNHEVYSPIKLALAPDRPQARPGEVIRARILCVSQASQRPQRDRMVEINMLDPRGNRIGHVETRTTEFGLAWAEFPLDSQAPEGAYTLNAKSEGLHAQRKVLVQQYRLPPFKVDIALDRPWFGPRDQMTGHIKAMTFDGHPLASSKGTLLVRDENGQRLFSKDVLLNEQALQAFSISIASLKGVANQTDSQRMRISVELTDPAGRLVEQDKSVVVSALPVLISAVPEAGALVQGVVNRVYLVALTPDGKPAANRSLELSVPGVAQNSSITKRLVTDQQGVAQLELELARSPAEVITVRLSGNGGNEVARAMPQRVSIPVRPESLGDPEVNFGRLLIRTDRAVYKGGDAVAIQAFSKGHLGAVHLSLRRSGSTVAVGGLDLMKAADGEASASSFASRSEGKAILNLPEDAEGLYVLEAVLLRADGMKWYDRRHILVAGHGNLKVVATSDQGSKPYAPGGIAKLSFKVTNKDGVGVPAAVSVVGVDEALLALSGEHPGLAQALQGQGIGVMGRVDGEARSGGPFNSQGLTVADGAKESAFVKLASLQDKDTKGAADIETIDSRNAKIMALRDYHYDASIQAAQWAIGLAGLLLMIAVLMGASKQSGTAPISTWSLRYVEQAIPLVAFGILGLSIISATMHGLGHSMWVIAGLTILGAITRRFLFQHGLSLMTKRSYSTFFTLIGVCDLVLVALTLSLAYVWLPNESVGYLFFAMVLVTCIFSATPLIRKLLSVEAIAKGSAVVACLLLIGFVLAPFTMLSSNRQYKSRNSALPLAGNDEPKEEGQLSADATPDSIPLPINNASAGRVHQITLPRLRRDFREALIFAPEIITDEQGLATLNVPLADSLTSWRVQTDAIGKEGGTAWMESTLIVTQPFSVDVTLPTSVTVGDLLEVPVVVSNHQDVTLKVTLAIEADGAELEGTQKLTLMVEPRSVAALPFTLRFAKAGVARIGVMANADIDAEGLDPAQLIAIQSQQSDAVERRLQVQPFGRPMGFASSSMVMNNSDLPIVIPPQARPETIRARLSIHRGPLTQMIEGFESMLREPHGCFEQTSSTNYPNIMIMQYLKAYGVKNPALESRTRNYLARGYQRLLGFEVNGQSGSFSLYGQAPANPWLTAYALMQFKDMAEVYPVDPKLLQRIREWLRGKMASDGSFNVSNEMGKHSKLAGTAYVVWAFGDAAPSKAIQYLASNWRVADTDPYLSALVAIALAKHDRAVAGQLVSGLKRHLKPALNGKMMLSTTRTLAWGRGSGAEVETTALGVLAILHTRQAANVLATLLPSLQSRVAPGGGWGSTHSTVLALKALTGSAGAPRGSKAARIVIELNGQVLDPIEIPAKDDGVPISIPLSLTPGQSDLIFTINEDANGQSLIATVTGEAFIPWGAEANLLPQGSMAANVTYSSTEVEKGKTILGTLKLSGRGTVAEVPMVEWGLPAGFSPLKEDLEQLKGKGVIKRWEQAGRSLRLYFADLPAGESLTLPVRFRANAKGTFHSAPGRVYEYYQKENATQLPPVQFTVK